MPLLKLCMFIAHTHTHTEIKPMGQNAFQLNLVFFDTCQGVKLFMKTYQHWHLTDWMTIYMCCQHLQVCLMRKTTFWWQTSACCVGWTVWHTPVSVWPVNNCCGCMHQHFSPFGLPTCGHWLPTLHTAKYPSSCKYQSSVHVIFCQIEVKAMFLCLDLCCPVLRQFTRDHPSSRPLSRWSFICASTF